ncbi:hypothetical protein TNCV_696881 [Trichonephila clavipes]|nr:hypothetical protein TNCV_696881 [Trichonephila clavipes]
MATGSYLNPNYSCSQTIEFITSLDQMYYQLFLIRVWLVLIAIQLCKTRTFVPERLGENVQQLCEYVALKLHAVVICVTVLVMPNVTVSQHVLKYAVQQQEEMDVA